MSELARAAAVLTIVRNQYNSAERWAWANGIVSLGLFALSVTNQPTWASIVSGLPSGFLTGYFVAKMYHHSKIFHSIRRDMEQAIMLNEQIERDAK